MNLANTALVNNASAGSPGSAANGAQIFVLKKAMNLQAEGAAVLLASVPQPPAPSSALASSGNLGTRLNTYA